ncbi:hypothetical protein TrVE_jg9572 [Triparma verrucosa]|uniref:dihydroorotase n=1 Tax=Triparma verrucosa TaxID=1606542 RepID=A0A9W7BRF7_9STRA|nr:hypothetical protein TrVE_jg9572 [Triparma verrucosa]
MRAAVPDGTEITIPYPCDFHHHFRQSTLVDATVKIASERFQAALAMPNTSPPITTVELCQEYYQKLTSAAQAAPAGAPNMEFLSVLYLTDMTTVATVEEMVKHPNIRGFKYYPAGATTNSAFGVTDVNKLYPVFSKMQELGLVLCIHSEVSRIEIDIFDREKVFIEEVIRPLVKAFPTLKIVMEHISTSFGVDFINEIPGDYLKGSITPHHLVYNRNALLVGGVKPHFYCLPILKRESHRVALLEAATSQSGKFISGTDSAPHDQARKESCCGCAGVFNGHNAVELYVEIFESVGKLDALANFFQAGKDFYNIGGDRVMKLRKESWKVPETFDFPDEENPDRAGKLVPLRAGEDMLWKIV